jgi:predicted dehydrogenase
MVVMCDASRKRLDHLKRLYPDVAAEQSFDAVIDAYELDAVAIATPVSSHYELARRCLEKGLHTFIEKPMGRSSAECDELVSMAADRKLTLMVGHTFLYSPPVRKIKAIVDSGDLGQIRYISMRRLNLGLFQKDINVVWDLAPHDISIINYIMNERPCALNCQGKANVTKNIEDVANMTLFFPGGGFAMLHTSWLDPKKVRDMTIVGTKRMLLYDDLEPLQKIKIFDMRVDVPPHYDSFAAFQCSYHYGDMYAPRVEQDEPLKIECGHFLDCIRSGKKPMTSGESGSDLVRVLEAADASLRENGARVGIGAGN